MDVIACPDNARRWQVPPRWGNSPACRDFHLTSAIEGLEVAFIALTFGSNQGEVPLAAIAAGIAVALVVTIGVSQATDDTSWIVPVAIVGLLPLSLRRATGPERRTTGPADPMGQPDSQGGSSPILS